MPRESAGILLFRERERALEVLLVHPGGPLWAKKDDGAWTIPKGELDPGEEPLAAARRELEEEIGLVSPGGEIALGTLRQRSGKLVHAFAARGDFDPARLVSGTFRMEWPPRSGREGEFPEVDRAAWFAPEDAARKLLAGQAGFLERLLRALGR